MLALLGPILHLRRETLSLRGRTGVFVKRLVQIALGRGLLSLADGDVYRMGPAPEFPDGHETGAQAAVVFVGVDAVQSGERIRSSPR